MTAPELDPEDAKLVTLARSARARNGAETGSAVRDGTGRTYVATSVQLPSLSLTALQVAVAMAVSSGASELEAAVVLGGETLDPKGAAAVHDISAGAPVYFAAPDGTLR